jgi:putative glycosyltransferase (TIGR04372 family)
MSSNKKKPKPFEIVKALLFLPFVLIVILLKPFVLVRFGLIDSSRIGHFCNAAGYIGLRREKKMPDRSFDVLSYSNTVCNKHLQKVLDRYITPLSIAGFINRMNWALNFWKQNSSHKINFPVYNLRLVHDENNKLEFTGDERAAGLMLLEQLGMPKDASWICIHNRDGRYLDTVQPDHDWNYHNFRDFNIDSMVLAAEELTSRGYYVVRMGSISEEPMFSENPMIIDYANHNKRSDFADIYLLGNCHFYLGSDSGIFAVSTIFNRPFSFINFPVPQPIGDYYRWSSSPFILKHFFLEKEARRLSLREIFEYGLANMSESKGFEKTGVKLLSNTPKEIRDLAIEVDERIKGKWQDSAEDEELQQMFWEIYQEYSLVKEIDSFNARIGAAFLRDNQYFLD